MREGIYRIETTIGQMSSNGVAMINDGRIKGLDNDYVYVGNQVIKKGKGEDGVLVPRGIGHLDHAFPFDASRQRSMTKGPKRNFGYGGESDADVSMKSRHSRLADR